ncbi:esterase-like activity of phytase family protein [Agrobacterium vitis]|uniref:esterase-like activity of phytase family protein n=1 Tax=Agrobacterium vitis TaxID=373 RepID=UPI001F295D87|nr:esterase-like activity of phytase family protein [Agrobacterium vitis]
MTSRKALAAFCCGSVLLLAASQAVGESATVGSRRIEYFNPASDQTVFGKLEFIGGLDLTSSDSLFGAWSSIRFRPDGKRFIGVLDTGDWISGEIVRDEKGRLAGIDTVSLAPMLDRDGRGHVSKRAMDAESLAIRGDKIYVGFEQRHRIDQYPLDGFETAKPEKSLPLPFPKKVLESNRSLEMLTASPAQGPLAGGLVTITEESLDAKGNLYAGVVDGAHPGGFKLVRRDDFDVTDGAWLPDGDLLLLERRFRFPTGLGMRIVRVKGDSIKPGALVDGEILLDADQSFQIDNMEGLDVVDMGNGDLRLILVSDDNHFMLQRTLMLEFRLLP